MTSQSDEITKNVNNPSKNENAVKELTKEVISKLNDLLSKIDKVKDNKEKNDMFDVVVKGVEEALPKKGFFGGDYKLTTKNVESKQVDSSKASLEESEGSASSEESASQSARNSMNGGRRRRVKKTKRCRSKKGGRKSKRR